jgi:hypothetical protein
MGNLLKDWSSENTRPDSYNYVMVAEDRSSTGNLLAIKAKRNDGKETIFTKARFAELVKDGKISITGDTTFTLKNDADFNPASRFTPLA